MVLSPEALLKEVRELEANGVAVRDRLRISLACPIILRTHVRIDQARERARGNDKIGTTGRGIGPAYEDKVSRRGVRLGDLFNPVDFEAKLREIMSYHNFVLTEYFKEEAEDIDAALAELMEMGEEILPMAADVTDMLHDFRKRGEHILFEGAQGSLLDIDLGTYPYVTSSNTTAGVPPPVPVLARCSSTMCWESPRPTPLALVLVRSRPSCFATWGITWLLRAMKLAPPPAVRAVVAGLMQSPCVTLFRSTVCRASA